MLPPDFNTRVNDLVSTIPPGKVSTYGIIAELAGARSGARMVGWVLSSADTTRVPAHRVVNRFGALTGKHHFPTPESMRMMLEKEGVTFLEDGTVSLERHLWRFEGGKD